MIFRFEESAHVRVEGRNGLLPRCLLVVFLAKRRRPGEQKKEGTVMQNEPLGLFLLAVRLAVGTCCLQSATFRPLFVDLLPNFVDVLSVNISYLRNRFRNSSSFHWLEMKAQGRVVRLRLGSSAPAPSRSLAVYPSTSVHLGSTFTTRRFSSISCTPRSPALLLSTRPSAAPSPSLAPRINPFRCVSLSRRRSHCAPALFAHCAMPPPR
jgi:hypothetical protein